MKALRQRVSALDVVGSVSGALGMGGCLMSHFESSEVIMSYFILFVSAVKMIFILSNLRIEAVFSGVLNGRDPWRISTVLSPPSVYFVAHVWPGGGTPWGPALGWRMASADTSGLH